jgi:hypothetical protein
MGLMATDLDKTQDLRTGDDCEFRYPARQDWRQGVVVINGRGGYWGVMDVETGEAVGGLYIEHVRAPDTDPWS